MLTLGLVTALVGCRGATSTGGTSEFAPRDTLATPSSAERDSALALLQRMERTVFDSAFVRLEGRGFTRRVRTEQLAPGGSIRAWRERVLRYPPAGPASMVDTDSMGTFESGIDALSRESDPTARPGNLATSAFPDKPAYLTARTQEAFAYHLLDDTLGTQPVRTVVVRPRDTPTGQEQSLRYTRLHIHPATNQLLAAYAVRAERVLLFREDSQLYVRLRPVNGTWLPHVTRFRARVDIPFRSPQQFRTTSDYGGWE